MMTHKVDRVAGSGELAVRVGAILEAMAPLPHREEVVAAALAAAGHDAIPETPEELLFFATGPLYEHAQASWGAEVADAILLELAPVLDRAWERDRLEVVGEMPVVTKTPTPWSGVRRRSDVVPPEVERAIQQVEERDTVPAPPPEPSAAPEDEISHDAIIPRSRITVPYTSVAWSSAHNTPRVLVLAGDDELRARTARALRGQRYALATASHRDGARALFARLEPDLVVAELEAIAPDFEPIRPALELLFGTAPPAKVVLVSDVPLRESFDAIAAVLPSSVTQDEICTTLTLLLKRD